MGKKFDKPNGYILPDNLRGRVFIYKGNTDSM